jgi:DNA-binding XRE family transcriptional regulator
LQSRLLSRALPSGVWLIGTDSEPVVAVDKLPTGRMIRAARALVGMEQLDLAREIGVDRRTVSRLEADMEIPVNPLKIATYRKMRDALEKHGVVFLYGGKAHGEGVALKD